MRTPPEVLAELERLLAASLPPPWTANIFVKQNGEPIESVEDVVECLAASARCSDNAKLYGISARDEQRGDEPIVCYTGNGPMSGPHAKAVAALRGAAASMIADCRALAEAERKAQAFDVLVRRCWAINWHTDESFDILDIFDGLHPVVLVHTSGSIVDAVLKADKEIQP